MLKRTRNHTSSIIMAAQLAFASPSLCSTSSATFAQTSTTHNWAALNDHVLWGPSLSTRQRRGGAIMSLQAHPCSGLTAARLEQSLRLATQAEAAGSGVLLASRSGTVEVVRIPLRPPRKGGRSRIMRSRRRQFPGIRIYLGGGGVTTLTTRFLQDQHIKMRRL